MVKTYSRMLALVLMVALAVFSVQRVAKAAAQTPEEIVQSAIDQMEAAYAAFSGRVDVLVNEAVLDLAGRGSGDLTLTTRLKGLAGFMSALEKDCDKTTKQIQKIGSRAVSQLQRMGADAEFVEEVTGVAGLGAGSVDATRFFASAEVYTGVGEYSGFLE